MPGVTPLLHTVVKGEANPYSTVYISPTNGVTDSSVTLGEGTNFEIPIGFYAGSKALVKVVRTDGTQSSQMIDLKEDMPDKVVWFYRRGSAGYGTYDTGWKAIPDNTKYVYRVMGGMVYVRRNSEWQTDSFTQTKEVTLATLPSEVRVKSRATFVFPKADYTDDGSIIEVWPATENGGNKTPVRVVAQIANTGGRIIPVVFAPVEYPNG